MTGTGNESTVESLGRTGASTARDYYGDLTSHPMTSEGSASRTAAERADAISRPGTEEAVEAVKRALQRDQEGGMLRPKAAGRG